jgi:hypothetical protein
MHDPLTRPFTRRLSQNLGNPLAIAAPLGRQLLDGLRQLRGSVAPASDEPVSPSADSLAGWGLRNPRGRSAASGRPQGARAAMPQLAAVTPPPTSSALPAKSAQPLVAAPSPVGGMPGMVTSRRPLRATRCSVDPVDARRTVISGRMSDVCDALDRLIALQAAQSVRPALAGAN